MRKTLRSRFMLMLVLVASALVRVHTQLPASERQLPSLSLEMRKYYQAHPEEWAQFVGNQPPVLVTGEPAAEPTLEPAPGTWSTLTSAPPTNLSNPILLTDGTVIAHKSCSTNWYKFTPSNAGNYINGTWSAIASTAAGYNPRFFGSAVLPDGRVVIEGGEYDGAGCGAVWGTKGAIYDPVANTWTPIAPPAGWGRIGDATGIILANGTYMQTSCCDNPPHAALLNPSSLTWTATGGGKFDVYDEENIALLQDDTLLTVDAYVFTGTCGTNSERYNQATGLWTSAGSTIVKQADCDGGVNSFEAGPVVQRYNGTAVSFSGRSNGAPQTAIYNVAAHTWAAGPVLPSFGGVPYTVGDAPATVMPNGNVLVAMSPSNWATLGSFPAPTHYWELEAATNTFTLVPDKLEPGSWNAYQQNMLLLPTGQVMSFTIDSAAAASVQIYTPTGTFNNAWRPTITSLASTLVPGATFSLGGTQLNGLTEGSMYGDDTMASTNFPLVRITNNGTGHVFYARTFNHSTRSIAPGLASTTSFTVPAGIETGASTLQVVANGIPSLAANVTVTNPQKAAIYYPVPGSTISGTISFYWDTGVAASQYWLYVGTTGVGSANIYNASQGTATSASVPGIPASGTIYVRLWTLLPGGWQWNDYTYVGGAVAANIISPIPGSTISGTVPFSWDDGIGISQYWLYVGTTGVGSSNIYTANQGTAHSVSVPGIPASGTIYVRLWSLGGNGWLWRDYTYVGGSVAASITLPTPNTELIGSSVVFNWNAGMGNTQYWLYVGSTGVGSANIYSASQGTSQSATVNALPPPSGGTIYVRLWSLSAPGWKWRDYTYTSGTAQAAVLTTPAPGSAVNGPSMQFVWNAGKGASQYWLYVGSTGVGSANVYNASQGTALSTTVGSLPTTAVNLYARLWTLLPTGWTFNDYTFRGGSAAIMKTPTQGSILYGSSVTFNWNAGNAATQYYLYVGTTGVGSANIYNSSVGTSLSQTVGGIPTSGPVYVRLWALSGSWHYNDYTYTGGGAGNLITPTPNSALGSSSTTFNWAAGASSSSYWLFVGTAGPGSFNIYNASQGTNLSGTVTGLPTSETIYVRLWSYVGTWVYNDYVYRGSGAAAIKWPAQGSTLSGSSVTFDWDAGNGANYYWVFIGTTGAGSANIYNDYQALNRSVTVTNIPTSGTVYVRMWTLLNTGWVFNDYTYAGGPLAALPAAAEAPAP